MAEPETAKYCIKCESLMLLKKNNTTGAQFYSCSNWPGCKFTQSVKAAIDPLKTSTGETESAESRAANQSKAHALETCAATLEEISLRLGTIGPAIEAIAMASAIPGFGKTADELTDAEREARAVYFSKRVKGVDIKPLPYNPAEMLSEQSRG